MRRRLVLVVVGTVAAALTLAAGLAFVLLGRDARQVERRSLAAAAQRVAERSSAVRSLETVGRALDLAAAAQISVDPTVDLTATDGPEIGNSFGDLPDEVIAAALDSSARTRLQQNRTVSGITSDRAWAAAPVRTAPRLEVLVLVRTLPDTAARTIRFIALASVAALVLAAVAAFVIARGLARPLREATAAYRRIASGDLSVRATRNRDRQRADEIGELVRALDTMTDALERARNQERSFLMSVSHDLRTPLTSIRGYAEAIAEGTAPDERRAAEVIGSESRRLERLVRDLLDLARLEADQFTLATRETDVTDLVTDAADGFLPAARRAGVDLDLEAADGVRAVVDPERLMQMIANLTENALKFARSRVVVSLRAEPGDGLSISVADDGPGIAPEDLPHVFERSYASDRHGLRAAGSGIGLAIVRELSGAMGGSVDVTTGPGGTVFRIVLPVGPSPAPVAR
jgi:two-component system sensor histidine kinase BaeS